MSTTPPRDPGPFVPGRDHGSTLCPKYVRPGLRCTLRTAHLDPCEPLQELPDVLLAITIEPAERADSCSLCYHAMHYAQWHVRLPEARDRMDVPNGFTICRSCLLDLAKAAIALPRGLAPDPEDFKEAR